MRNVKEKIQRDFDAVMHQLLNNLSSLDEEELNSLPYEQSWTAGQVGDHLFKSYKVADILNGKMEKTERDPWQKLADVEKTFLDFSIKMKAPMQILPATGKINQNRLLLGLRERIDQQREAILKKDLTKTCLDFAIPEYGNFTRLEWLGFNIVHTKRHLYHLMNIISLIKDRKEMKIKPSER